MKRLLSVVLPPEIALDSCQLEAYIAKQLGCDNVKIRLLRRSIDARSRQIKVSLQMEVYVGEPLPPLQLRTFDYQSVGQAKPVLVVGAGPAGLFAALRLIELGIKPIVIERGKNIKDRLSDIAEVSRRHQVNPDSNYCFGEGGAGTYSDGKLYTRSTKRGDFRRILEIFVAHGANPDILVDTHPHIGTNKLPAIVAAIRQTILSFGGEVLFGNRVIDFGIEANKINGVWVQDVAGNSPASFLQGKAVILATGHSARDIFELLHRKKILIEAKPFALGVRVEHPQAMIDQVRYNGYPRNGLLPAASYSLVCQSYHNRRFRGVFSFCMCPGGYIVPAATASGEVVVNGMSHSLRNSKYANSGIVVAIEREDWAAFANEGPLAALRFQQAVEAAASREVGGTQQAPAQRIADFVAQKPSTSLPKCSYQPGLVATNLWRVLPHEIAERLRLGFLEFEKKMRGFITGEGVALAVESRTSSPVRIPRNPDTLQHPQIEGLYPCGEGAGYAGGIASAAMDGERCAEAVAKSIGKN